MIVQHNLSAQNAFGISKKTAIQKGKSSEKLSSGYRINRAADNAAGLQISEKMRWQIRGLNQASENAQTGISLLQTADGALEEIQDIIQRIRELSVQAASDSNTVSDREAIQDEISGLQTEINRIAGTAEFNTMKLFDGSMENTSLISSNAQQATFSDPVYQAINGFNMTAEFPVVGSGVALNQAQIDGLNDVLKNSIVPQAVNAFLGNFPSLASAAANGQVSDEIGLLLYGDNSTTLASVAMKYGSNGGTNQIVDNSISLRLSVNTNALAFNGNNLTDSSRVSLETTIVHEMMHAFMDDITTNGMLGATNGIIDSSNQFPLWFIEGAAQSAAGGCANFNDWVNGAMGLTEQSSISDISNAVRDPAFQLSSGTSASCYGNGYLACMYLSYLADGTSAVTGSSLANGLDQILKKLTEGDSLDKIIKDISGSRYSGLADFQSSFGDTDSSEFIHKLLAAVGNNGNGGLINKNLQNEDLLPNSDTSSSVYKLNIGSEFVSSSVGGNRNWGSGGAINNGSGSGQPPSSGDPDPTPGTTVVSRRNGLHLQVGALSGQDIVISLGDMHTNKLGLDQLSVIDYESAGQTISACDSALSAVSNTRSRIGAYTNRLEHTYKNLDNVSENTQAAESLLRDTDMAQELVEYSKNQVLSQAGDAMISQAIELNESILTLLNNR